MYNKTQDIELDSVVGEVIDEQDIQKLSKKDPYILLSGKNPKTEWVKNEDKTDLQRMEEWQEIEDGQVYG